MADLADVGLDDPVRARLSCDFSDGGLVIALPAGRLVAWRAMAVTVEAAAGPRVIFRRDLCQIDDPDRVKVCLPPAMVGVTPMRVAVHLLGDGGPRSVSFTVAADPAKLTPDLLNFYLNRGGGGNPVVAAFAKAVGGRKSYAEDGLVEGIPVVWGVRRGSKEIIDQAVSRAGFFYFIDNAYFGRGHYNNYRITRNGFEAGAIRRCPPDRIKALGVEAAPWNRGGEYVLVCPPTEPFMRAHGCGTWLEETLVELKRHTDRKIVVRQKPRAEETVVPLDDALRGAHALVTHSSNIAVEAAVAGTPVFVAPTSAAAPVGLTDLSKIESPVFPDRDPWLAHLAYSQFSFEELGTGQAWRMLLEWEGREFV
jgi:hypothetical protein